MNTLQWQVVSFISKFSSILMGLVSTIIVLRIISPEDWGIIGLAMSVVGIVSVIQHLGLATGLNREIANEKEPQYIPSIIYTALLLRLPLSLLIATSMTVFAQYISIHFYNNPALTFPIQLLAILVIIEGVQDIFSTSVGALKLFRGLFVFQVVLSFINFIANVAGVTYFGSNGYFYAKYVYFGSSFLVYGIVLFRHFGKQSVLVLHIEWNKVRTYIKGLLGIGWVSFLQKILNIYWLRLPTIIMGTLFSAATLGVYNFADYFTQRLSIFADAATDVSVPVFLRTYQENYEQFKKDFIHNFLRVTVITIFFAVFGTLFLPEFLAITGLTKYEGVQSVFLPSALAMSMFSIMSTLSVLFVAAYARKHMLISYALIFVTTLITLTPFAKMWGIAGGGSALALGAFIGLLYYILVLWKQFALPLITIKTLYLFTPPVLLFAINTNVSIRIVLSIIFLILFTLFLRHFDRTLFDMLTAKVQKIFSQKSKYTPRV